MVNKIGYCETPDDRDVSKKSGRFRTSRAFSQLPILHQSICYSPMTPAAAAHLFLPLLHKITRWAHHGHKSRISVEDINRVSRSLHQILLAIVHYHQNIEQLAVRQGTAAYRDEDADAAGAERQVREAGHESETRVRLPCSHGPVDDIEVSYALEKGMVTMCVYEVGSHGRQRYFLDGQRLEGEPNILGDVDGQEYNIHGGGGGFEQYLRERGPGRRNTRGEHGCGRSPMVSLAQMPMP
ncbi:hypothetical protein B0H19DRAFT_1129201 [Mycena capillaripes]|nr:hypothetical protein B0H19DRAFT_1129201 [Mycena capillaripes]